MSQWGKSGRGSVLHGVWESLDSLARLTRRAPGRGQGHRPDQNRRLPGKRARRGPRRLKTNLSFASLVTREWLRRRALAEALRRGAAPSAGAAQDAGVMPLVGVGWVAAPVRAAETGEPTEAGWAVDPEYAVDPEWAAEFESPADRDRAR